jgi:hypothetical protein
MGAGFHKRVYEYYFEKNIVGSGSHEGSKSTTVGRIPMEVVLMKGL